MSSSKSSLESLVSCSPDLMSGTPAFAGKRVPIENLFDYLAAGDSLDEFVNQFPTVKREQAIALLSFTEELILARFGEASPR